MFEVVVGGRAFGKTHAAVQWVKQDPGSRAIVTINHKEAERLIEEYELPEECVIVADKAPHELLGRSGVDVILDNADIFLQQLFNGHLHAITMSQATTAVLHGPRDLSTGQIL